MKIHINQHLETLVEQHFYQPSQILNLNGLEQ